MSSLRKICQMFLLLRYFKEWINIHDMLKSVYFVLFNYLSFLCSCSRFRTVSNLHVCVRACVCVDSMFKNNTGPVDRLQRYLQSGNFVSLRPAATNYGKFFYIFYSQDNCPFQAYPSSCTFPSLCSSKNYDAGSRTRVVLSCVGLTPLSLVPTQLDLI